MNLSTLLFYLSLLYLSIKFLVFILQTLKQMRYLVHFPRPRYQFYSAMWKSISRNSMRKDITSILNRASDKLQSDDKIFFFWALFTPTIVLHNRDYAKIIFSQKDPDYLNKSATFYLGLEQVAPNNMLSVKGANWNARRKILSEPFHRTNMGNFKKIISPKSSSLVDHFKNHPCKDLLCEMKSFSLEFFCKFLFEYDLDRNENRKITEMSDLMFKILQGKAYGLFRISEILYCFTSQADRQARVLREAMEFKYKILNETAESLQEELQSSRSKDLDSTKSGRSSMAAILLKNAKGSAKIKSNLDGFDGFDNQEIASHINAFIIGGLDSLSASLSFMIYHLAKYPNYQQQIYEEIEEHIGVNPNNNIELNMEDVKKIVSLDLFIRESLRIQPVARFMGRQFNRDLVLDEKYTIPANTDVLINIGRMMKDPDYFTEPDEFRPERFLEDQKDNLYSYAPFSAGIRNCIAKQLSLDTMAFVGADLVRNFPILFQSSSNLCQDGNSL